VGEAIAGFPLPGELKTAIAHSLSVPVSFVLIAYLQIVLGELCPKSLALLYSEQIARFLAAPSLVISRIFNPFVWVLNQSTRCLLKLVGAKFTGQEWYNSVPAEELRLMIATDKELSGLEKEERQLLNNVFEFSDVVAVEVMTPRTKITSLPMSATFEVLLNQVATTGHFCYPVIGDSLDNIRGVIDFKELALPLAQGLLSAETPLENWVKPARFVPEGIFLSELLSIMQRSRQKMAIVVDEFGGTSGLVTIQDLIVEIIGEEKHQQNYKNPPLEVIDQDTFLLQADMYIEQVNELLNLNLDISDEYQTLGGFLIYKMQRIPSIGETLDYKNWEFTVISAEGPKLKKIQLYRRDSFNSDLAPVP
jgi:CBS domain containing-hemolysin-like protein